MANEFPERIIRFSELHSMIGLSRAWIWTLEAEGKFPRRIQIAPNSIGWKLSEVMEWINSRPTATLRRKSGRYSKISTLAE